MQISETRALSRIMDDPNIDRPLPIEVMYKTLLLIAKMRRLADLLKEVDRVDSNPSHLLHRVAGDPDKINGPGEIDELLEALSQDGRSDFEGQYFEKIAEELADIWVLIGSYLLRSNDSSLVLDKPFIPDKGGRTSATVDGLRQRVFDAADDSSNDFRATKIIIARLRWMIPALTRFQAPDFYRTMIKVTEKVLGNRDPDVYSIFDHRYKEELRPFEFQKKFMFLEEFMRVMRKMLGRNLTKNDWQKYYWNFGAYWRKSEESLTNLVMVLQKDLEQKSKIS